MKRWITRLVSPRDDDKISMLWKVTGKCCFDRYKLSVIKERSRDAFEWFFNARDDFIMNERRDIWDAIPEDSKPSPENNCFKRSNFYDND